MWSQSNIIIGDNPDSTIQYMFDNPNNLDQYSNQHFDEFFNYTREENLKCEELKLFLIQSEWFVNHGDYKNALRSKFQFDSTYNPQCDSNLIIYALMTEGLIYYDNLEYDKAKKIIDHGVDLYNEKWGEPLRLSSLYSLNGNIFFANSDFVSAKSSYKKGIEVLGSNNVYNTKEKLFFNLAICNYYLNISDSIYYYLNKSMNASRASSNYSLLSSIYNFKGELASSQADKLLYIDSAISIAEEKKMLMNLVTLKRNKSITLEETKRYHDAYNTLWDAFNYKDSLYKEQTAEAVAQLDAKYKMAQKDIEIKQLKISEQEKDLKAAQYKSNQLILVLGSLVLIGAIIVIAIRYYEVKKTKDILRKKNQLISSEKERSEELLLNILPFEVAEELKDKGESEARQFDEVSVLFTDFKEFTKTASKLDAKSLVTEINECFKVFDDIIDKYKIEKIKTIGDAYMAAGGLHTPRNSEPKDVVLAAIEMQEFISKRKKQHISNGLPYFEMRIGIHTGPVVAGIVGVKKFQYDIWGDTVNTASRMESSGEVGKVNISNDTYDLIKDDKAFNFNDRGLIEVKGKGQMKMWFVALV